MRPNKRETTAVVAARFTKPVLDLGDLLKKKKKGHKYNARRTIVYGKTFDSRAEAARYLVLKDLSDRGVIRNLKTQVEYKLPAGIKYFADFSYTSFLTKFVEDVKGRDTAASRIKRKLVWSAHGVDVKLVKMDSETVDMLLKAAGARDA